MNRKSGVLMHISSLYSKSGIGTMGDEAYKFVDFLVDADQTYWQILPLSQTGFGDSPYQSFSAFAGNPYLIDLDYLCNDGLLSKADFENVDWQSDDGINFGVLYEKRYPILKKACKNFLDKNDLDDFYKFEKENDWLEDYALFMTIKEKLNNISLIDWDYKYKTKDKETIDSVKIEYSDTYNFWKVVQYLFFKQWFNLKKYANEKGIEIIGDCPLYVSSDSCDVFSNPKLFLLDENLIPKKVAGCPPDGFAADGQLWGNPIYDWDYHLNTNFAWWVKRIKHLCSIYDYVRVDHFRGLSAYYTIDYGAVNAREGKWVTGPGKDFVKAIKDNVGDKVIAEDLGYMDDDVKDLLKYSGYPGMGVLEFAFDTRDADSNDNIPYNLKKNQIAYIGTHDNQTVMGWIKEIPEDSLKFCKEYINYHEGDEFNWTMIKCLMATVCDTAIVQVQDLLGLDEKARMNTPSTVGTNWKWMVKENSFTKELCEKLKEVTHLYGRA